MIEGRVEYKVIAAIQKPYDLLNALEYVRKNGLPTSDLMALIIGMHANARAVADLCEKNGITILRAPDPDFYARCASWLNATRKFSGKVLLAVKGALLPIAYVAWLLAYLRARILMRGVRCDTLIFDAWSSKCLYMACIKADRHVLVDGGFSTLNYGLCEAFTQGGARELVRVSLSKQRPLLPSFLRAHLVKMTKPMSIFFTCYAGRIPDGCAYPHEGNQYEWSAMTLRRKPAGDHVLILGIPLLKHIDTYVSAALDVLRRRGAEASPASIEYRFHPTDRNRSSLDVSYKDLIERGATERGVTWSYPTYSLEIDFLEGKSVPSAIVCYESSSVAWIRSVMGDAVELKVLPER